MSRACRNRNICILGTAVAGKFRSFTLVSLFMTCIVLGKKLHDLCIGHLDPTNIHGWGHSSPICYCQGSGSRHAAPPAGRATHIFRACRNPPASAPDSPSAGAAARTPLSFSPLVPGRAGPISSMREDPSAPPPYTKTFQPHPAPFRQSDRESRQWQPQPRQQDEPPRQLQPQIRRQREPRRAPHSRRAAPPAAAAAARRRPPPAAHRPNARFC